MQTGFAVISFYKFFALFDVSFMRVMKDLCRAYALKGTVLLAREGINASLEGLDSQVDALVADLKGYAGFADLVVKKSPSNGRAFRKLEVKVKKEIVTLGNPKINPVGGMGFEVAPEDWDAFIHQTDVITIDTRNGYEFDMGTFPSSINPHTQSFHDFPAYVHANRSSWEGKRVAMFCTGGIRCEKASAFLLSLGISEVYQLKGGILNYFEKIPASQSAWRGECMVFDQRRSLNAELKYTLQSDEFGQ
jgi:UPF0176 protein